MERSQCFAHGQLYVAESRVTKEMDLRILPNPSMNGRVKNVVMREILDKEDIQEGDTLRALNLRLNSTGVVQPPSNSLSQHIRTQQPMITPPSTVRL
jgi:hypothetical protein